jgi:3-deoxy-D-manno-octulosonic-acid transferase
MKQLTESQMMDLMLSNKRIEGESFKDYKERRTFANKMIKKYLNK